MQRHKQRREHAGHEALQPPSAAEAAAGPARQTTARSAADDEALAPMRGRSCSTAGSASGACISLLREEDVSESLELARDKLPEETETSQSNSLLLSSL
jgi:hypothetical protein